jgi:hypothetical protein
MNSGSNRRSICRMILNADGAGEIDFIAPSLQGTCLASAIAPTCWVIQRSHFPPASLSQADTKRNARCLIDILR